MSVADNTRTQEQTKKMEESIRNMVKGMLQENNKKQEEIFTGVMSEIKTLISSVNKNINPAPPSIVAPPTISISTASAPTERVTSALPSSNTSPVNNTQIPIHPSVPSFIDLTHQTYMNPNNIPYQMATRFTKVEFPKFDGVDLEGWLFKCERFFQIDFTPPNAKVKLAAIHLEGKALQWHQSFVKNRNKVEEPPWEEYVEALKGRFGEKVYEDPMADLKGLVQTGSLQEYLEDFDIFSHKVNLTEDYSLSCFLSGLKDEIRIPVRMFGPKNLQQAYALARMQDSYLLGAKNQKTYSNRSVIPTTTTTPANSTLIRSTPTSNPETSFIAYPINHS